MTWPTKAGADVQVFLRTKDAKMKGMSGASAASALFGITEPAIFGVNLRLRWPFFIGIAAAGVAGQNAANIALGMGAEVTILDTDLDKLRMTFWRYDNRVRQIASSTMAVREQVLGAVKRICCAECDANGDDPLQHARLGEVEVQRNLGPFDDDELQGGTGAPEQRRHGERDLPEPVAPEQGDAVVEFADQVPGVGVQDLVVDPRFRDVQVEG